MGHLKLRVGGQMGHLKICGDMFVDFLPEHINFEYTCQLTESGPPKYPFGHVEMATQEKKVKGKP
jgi:hypothetical protein